MEKEPKHARAADLNNQLEERQDLIGLLNTWGKSNPDIIKETDSFIKALERAQENTRKELKRRVDGRKQTS